MKKLKGTIDKKILYILTVCIIFFIPLMKQISFYLVSYGVIKNHDSINPAYILYFSIPFLIYIYIKNILKTKRELDIYDYIFYFLILTGLLTSFFSINMEISFLGKDYRHEGFLSLLSYYLLFVSWKEKGTKDFIVGYRISPEEVHGENVGYTVDDALVLVDAIVNEGVDYLHISSTGNDYDLMPTLGGCGKTLAKTIYDHVNKRTVVLAAGGINTPERALEALNSCDVCMLGRPVLIDPDFVVKLEEGREEEIDYSVENRIDKIAFPPILLGFWQMPGSPLAPLKGLNA